MAYSGLLAVNMLAKKTGYEFMRGTSFIVNIFCALFIFISLCDFSFAQPKEECNSNCLEIKAQDLYSVLPESIKPLFKENSNEWYGDYVKRCRGKENKKICTNMVTERLVVLKDSWFSWSANAIAYKDWFLPVSRHLANVEGQILKHLSSAEMVSFEAKNKSWRERVEIDCANAYNHLSHSVIFLKKIQLKNWVCLAKKYSERAVELDNKLSEFVLDENMYIKEGGRFEWVDGIVSISARTRGEDQNGPGLSQGVMIVKPTKQGVNIELEVYGYDSNVCASTLEMVPVRGETNKYVLSEFSSLRKMAMELMGNEMDSIFDCKLSLRSTPNTFHFDGNIEACSNVSAMRASS